MVSLTLLRSQPKENSLQLLSFDFVRYVELVTTVFSCGKTLSRVQIMSKTNHEKAPLQK